MATNSSLLKGSLSEFNLVEVLQMMELGSQTGALHLKHASGWAGVLYFNQGKMANCAELHFSALTLGDVLQQLGMATHEQIEHAFSQQLQSAFGMRIGEKLMMMGVISEQQLQEALRTKALWTARELGMWTDGIYEFIVSPNGQSILPYGEAALDLDVVRLTMEMVCYSDEWQELARWLPERMQTALQMAPSISSVLSFGTYAYELMMQVNRNRTVRRVACAMHLPEMDVARDLAKMVQHRMLIPIRQASPSPWQAPNNYLLSSGNENGNGNGASNGQRRTTVRLPDPAEKWRMESYELLDLISKMEQKWLTRRTPMEQLPALVEFVNMTMDSLADACRVRGTEIDQNALFTLLHRAGLDHLGNYRFIIEQNHVDVTNFTALCYEIMSGEISKATDFYEEASLVLQKMLRVLFETINARIPNPLERIENQEVWEVLFTQFALT
ncbi:MAG TPA: DUF4388 domain-containing protein [Ktedonobacteraceae bacterium]|nr:DUF4388 domain-containing protein [Ktedonobacteraceae bacterium]